VKRCAVIVLAGFLVAACGGDDDGDLPDQYEFGGDRPVFLDVPAAYDHAEPTPLVILLHGFGANGFTQSRIFGYDTLFDDYNVLFAAPDGTVNGDGQQFWNATDWCCGANSGIDDSTYLIGLVDEISAVWNVDPKRVYFAGHSNGGFMSYRLACDHSDRIAAIVSLAGATHLDPVDCEASEPVSVLQIHGDMDDTVQYAGVLDGYPSAPDTAAQWAENNGCAATRTADPARLDIVTDLAGEETSVEHHDSCPSGLAVDLWTIENGGHIPNLSDAFRVETWAWMEAHAKP
jgi:polyhydroxybutyrate depolymerase